MSGDEARVTTAFVDWLRDDGWTVGLEVMHVDVVAERGDHRLYAEVKGSGPPTPDWTSDRLRTASRRMNHTEPGDVRYAIVVPPGR